MKKTKKTALTAAILLAAANMASCDFPWSASDNEEKTVYGPPESYEVNDDSEDTDSGELSLNSFDPGGEVQQLEYGPPEMLDSYDPSSEEQQDVYGPPEDLDSYDPGAEIQQTEYDAPVDFEEDGGQ